MGNRLVPRSPAEYTSNSVGDDSQSGVIRMPARLIGLASKAIMREAITYYESQEKARPWRVQVEGQQKNTVTHWPFLLNSE